MSIGAQIRSKVVEEFAPTHLELENESHTHHRGGSDSHFRLLLVSARFQGLSRVERQRRVYALLDEERSQGLHALALWTYTPEEWANQMSQVQTSSPRCQGSGE